MKFYHHQNQRTQPTPFPLRSRASPSDTVSSEPPRGELPSFQALTSRERKVEPGKEPNSNTEIRRGLSLCAFEPNQNQTAEKSTSFLEARTHAAHPRVSCCWRCCAPKLFGQSCQRPSQVVEETAVELDTSCSRQLNLNQSQKRSSFLGFQLFSLVQDDKM